MCWDIILLSYIRAFSALIDRFDPTLNLALTPL